MRCQVLVVGAGPAGAELARQLATHSIDVLLVERLPDLRRAAFSSAALPLKALDAFGLPSCVVAQRWSGWELLGPAGGRRHWRGDGPQGVVLDFAALRQWLVAEAERWGARVWLGHQAVICREKEDGLCTTLRRSDGRCVDVHSDWVIDATGQERGLLGEPPCGELVSGVGLEWLVEVPQACWQRWSDRLAFCLGSDWVAQGYGWVFPMQSPRLKLGVCRLIDHEHRQEPLAAVFARLISRVLDPPERESMVVIDRHGGLIRSTIRRREPHWRGRLVGLGDAVSTANLLGGEGIRHALTSARVLAPLLLQDLRRDDRLKAAQRRHVAGERQAWPRLSDWVATLWRGAGITVPPMTPPRTTSLSLQRYPQELRRALGWRWSLSGRLARRTWLGLNGASADRRLDALLSSLENQPADVLSELLFDYRFERYGWRALPYLLGLR